MRAITIILLIVCMSMIIVMSTFGHMFSFGPLCECIGLWGGRLGREWELHDACILCVAHSMLLIQFTA